MLSNAYFLAKFRFDTAENEPAKNLQNLLKFANFADPNPLTLTLPGGEACGGAVYWASAQAVVVCSQPSPVDENQPYFFYNRSSFNAIFALSICAFSILQIQYHCLAVPFETVQQLIYAKPDC